MLCSPVFREVPLLFPVLSVVERLLFLNLCPSSPTAISLSTSDAVSVETRWLKS